MGRTTFVAWLYIMGGASIVIAIGDRAWGWLIGGAVFLAVADFARRKLKSEVEMGGGSARLSFVAVSILGMLIVMAFLFWLQFSA